jgi:hypothetical protein
MSTPVPVLMFTFTDFGSATAIKFSIAQSFWLSAVHPSEGDAHRSALISLSGVTKVFSSVRFERKFSGIPVIFLYFVPMAISPIISAQMPPPVASAAQASSLAHAIQDQHGTITSTDGTCLFYRYWPATAVWTGRSVLVLHGIGYHSGPYKVVADALNPRGIDVYGLDARAHGLSCGRRDYIGTPLQVAADVAAMARFIRRRAGTKLFLINDSMGCNYALDYAKDHTDEISGLLCWRQRSISTSGSCFN